MPHVSFDKAETNLTQYDNWFKNVTPFQILLFKQKESFQYLIFITKENYTKLHFQTSQNVFTFVQIH